MLDFGGRRKSEDGNPRIMEERPSNEAEAERLVQAHADLILRLSYTYLHSTHDAEDICQTVLVKLLDRAGAFESAEHERAWVVRTTANACKDVLRSARRRRSVGLNAAADAEAPEAPDSTVVDAVMSLPEAYREAIYLHYYEGYTAREIAGMTGRSEDAVAAHLSRGRVKLRSLLEGAEHER